MAFFEGNNMTGGYGDGPDIINSCSINVEKGEIVAILGPNGRREMWKNPCFPLFFYMFLKYQPSCNRAPA